MTRARAASGLLVSALIRQVEAQGGNGAVLTKGDATAGALLLLIAERGVVRACRERGLKPDGSPGWIESGPAGDADAAALAAYVARRRRFDPDMWVVELDGIDVLAMDTLLEAY